MRAREAATLLAADSVQMSQIESGVAGVSAERVRRLAALYACPDEALVEALASMATDRTQGWWEAYRGVLPPVFMDTAEVEHHAAYLREIVVTHVPGLLQTADYARAVYTFMMPGLPENEVDPRVEHRMRRQDNVFGDRATPYETIVHEFALRVRVTDRRGSLAQLRRLLDVTEEGSAVVRVIPVDQDGFAGAGASMLYAGGPVPRLDTVLRDAPTGTAFVSSEADLGQLRTLFRRVANASLGPVASRDLIHRLAKEL